MVFTEEIAMASSIVATKSMSVDINSKSLIVPMESQSLLIKDETKKKPPDGEIVNGVLKFPADTPLEISHEQPADIVSAVVIDQEIIDRDKEEEKEHNDKQEHSPTQSQFVHQIQSELESSSLSGNSGQEQHVLPDNNKTEVLQSDETILDGEPDTNYNKNKDIQSILGIPAEDKTSNELAQNNEDVKGDQDKLPLLKTNLSQELIVTIEKPPEVKVVTESLPEVLLVAEKLPEVAAVVEKIPLVNSARQLKRGQSVNQEDNISQYDDDVDVDDGGSTLTIGRTDTLSKQSEGNEVLHIESGREEEKWQKKETKHSHREEHVNEYCISPFFTVVYLLLGCLIIALIGVNFWFGFHLLLLIALLAVIALLVLLLTEFSEFHNLSI